MSYGAILSDLFRMGALYTDKILRGTKPGDLSIGDDMLSDLKQGRDTVLQEEGRSTKITDALNARGIPAPRGGQWYGSQLASQPNGLRPPLTDPSPRGWK
jgi:hypothetical protein